MRQQFLDLAGLVRGQPGEHVLEIGAGEIGFRCARIDQVGPEQVGADETGAGEIGLIEDGMEQVGAQVDMTRLVQMRDQLAADAAQAQETAWQFAGEQVNLQSPKQLQKILFRREHRRLR